MLPAAVTRYFASRRCAGPCILEGTERADFAGAVVIPALAESAQLPATLQALAANPAELLAEFLVVVTVNHRADAAAADREDNRRTLQQLRSGEFPPSLHLAWIDAASPGRELPAGEGVGLARKIGLDLVLERLDWQRDPLLVWLDADTLVDPAYLPAILAHFRRSTAGGAVLPFCHRRAETAAAEAAIVRYELFLRHYVLGLALAGSPYAFHTVGSALACRAGAYIRAGGMNRRCAAEDFHFLQQLAKTGGVAPLAGTTVHPSPRSSHRVPFGTGRSVTRLLADDPEAVRFYDHRCFRTLGDWLQLAAERLEATAGDLLHRAHALSPALGDFLQREGLTAVWPRLQRNHPVPAARLQAFHGWFDGLKSLRLVHHLSAGPHPRGEPQAFLPPLLRQAGIEPTGDLPGMLEQMRRLQGAA